MKQTLHVKQTHSTNNLLWELLRTQKVSDGFLLRADFQTDGKGQASNQWESEDGKNLLFSMVLFPHEIKIENQFILSQIVSLGIKRTLDEYVDNVRIKWPNDIYWNDKKIAGILIENSLQGDRIKTAVLGVGLNVNQKVFVSDAPNPVSLAQITGKRENKKRIVDKIRQHIHSLYANIATMQIQKEYFNALYRVDGFHRYADKGGEFRAKINRVYADGKMELITEQGDVKSFYFKEVNFLL